MLRRRMGKIEVGSMRLIKERESDMGAALAASLTAGPGRWGRYPAIDDTDVWGKTME